MLRAINGEPGMFRAWMRIGGDATLKSFGIEPPARGSDCEGYAEKTARAIPSKWLHWLGTRPLSARSGDYFFCHAGIRPGVPLKQQKRSDLLWIRDEFLGDRSNHGAVIVHGHSISAEVEKMGNRIGVDTGAYRTGILTALYLEGTEQQIFSTTVSDQRTEQAIMSEPQI